jgi:hypothetical protein
MRYVLSGSGHIAGVVNPPAKKKYQYWTGETPQGEDVEAWIATATEHAGVMVARLARMDQVAGRHRGPGTRARRRRLPADRGCAGELRQGTELSCRRIGESTPA